MNATVVISVLASLCTAGIITCIVLLVRHELRSQAWRKATEARLAELEKDQELREMALLNASKRGGKHHSYSTTAALQDAMAVLVDVMIDQDAESARLQTALGIIKAASNGPHAYDPERPAGKR